MDPVAKKSDLEEEHYKLSGDKIRKIKPPPEYDPYRVSVLDMMEYHQPKLYEIFKAFVGG